MLVERRLAEGLPEQGAERQSGDQHGTRAKHRLSGTLGAGPGNSDGTVQAESEKQQSEVAWEPLQGDEAVRVAGTPSARG